MVDSNGAAEGFAQDLIALLTTRNRFKEDLYKTKAPFNILCALDPRYNDLYLNEAEYEEVVKVIAADHVYDDVVAQ